VAIFRYIICRKSHLWPTATPLAALLLVGAQAADAAPVIQPPAAIPQDAPVNPADDPYLDMLLKQAVASHPSIGAARAAIRAAGADIRSAHWQAFPAFTVQGLLLNDSTNGRQASLVVDQPIWTGGRISSSLRRARAQHRAALAGYQQAVLDIMVGLSRSYRDYHRLNSKFAILQDSLTRHRELVATMERRLAQEISPLADLELARSRTAQIEQQVATTVAQRLTTLQKLRELVGDPDVRPGPPPAGGPLEPLDLSELVMRTLDFDPGRQRLIAEAGAARAEAAGARASIFPQLSGQYSYDDAYGHRVGLVLKAQSGGGFSSFSNAAAARERQDAAELRISATERDLRERTTADLADYESARSRIASTRIARDAADNVTASYIRQFTSGRRTWLDVMNAVREATTAQSEAIDAEASATEARDRLLMRSGSWPFPADSQDTP